MFLARTVTAALTILALVAPAAAHAETAAPLTIEVLSNRADLISADDALVAISYSEGVEPSDIRVKLGSRDVTSAAPRSQAVAPKRAAKRKRARRA
jgi:Tannase-like family of unknown function (DUF6351)